MADASIKVEYDNSELQSGIKSDITNLRKLADVQNELSKDIDESLDSQLASRKKGTEQLKKENTAVKNQVKELDKLEKELMSVGKAKKEAFSGSESKEFNENIKKSNNSVKELGKNSSVFDGIGSKIKDFVLSPLGLVTIAVTAIGKQFFDLGSQLEETTQITNTLFGDTEADLKSIQKEAILVANVFDKDVNEVLISANSVSKNFGISAQESLELIRTGIEKGADVNGEFLDQLKEYPAQFKLAGLSAEESIAIITQQVKSGVFSDKGVDAIKEATISLREMSPATEEALKAIGISGSEVQKQIQDGTRTYFDVIQEISSKTKEFGEDSTEAGVILADVFRGAGEDAGGFIFSLGELNTNLDTVQNTGSSLQIGFAKLKTVFQGFTIDLIQGSSATNVIGDAVLSFANRLDNLIKGIKDFNLNRLASEFLNLADTVTFGLFGLGEYADELREFEDLTDSVVNSVQEEVESVSVLTTALDENNKKLQDNSTTTEEATAIQEENKRIVDELNERYPEFTKNIDLQSASTEELTKLTKDLTDSFIENAIEQQKTARRAELLKELVNSQIELNRATREGEDGFLGIGSSIDTAQQRVIDAQQEINNLEKTYNEAGEAVKDLDLQLNTVAKNSVSVLQQAQQELKNLLNTQNLGFDTESVRAGITAQRSIIEAETKRQQEALDKELKTKEATELEAKKKEEEAKAKIRKEARAKASEEEIKEAKKLAGERQKILLDSENEYNKNISELLDLRTELYAESEADKILLQEATQLKEIENLKSSILDQQALLELSAEKGQEFVERSTQEELDAELEKYRQKVELTESQEEAISLLKQDVLNKTQESLIRLELEHQSELLSIQEETTSKKLQILEANENQAIERINNDTVLSEIQKESSILKIRQDSLEQKKSLIEEEGRLKEEQINKEIELLKGLNTEEANLKIESLEQDKILNQVSLDNQIESYDNQIEAGKTAVEEAEKVTFQAKIDSAIGKIFGVDSPDEIQAIKDTFKTLVDNLVNIYSAGIERELQANQTLLDGINQGIDEQENAINREIAKNQEGNASSIALEEEKLEELKTQREKALAEQEEIQKKQQQLDDLTQISALITASANIFKSLSGGFPATLPLAIGSVALMFGAFAKSKIDATKLEKGGTIKAGESKVIQGNRHQQGGENFLDHIEVEEGERASIFTRKATKLYSKEIIDFTNMINSGKKPVLPNMNAVNSLKSKENSLSLNVNNHFDSKELKANNKKMDKLIDLLSSQSQATQTSKGVMIRKGNSTTIIKA